MFGISSIGKVLGAGKGEARNQEEIQKALDEYANLYQPTVSQLGGKGIKSAYSNEDPRLRDYQLSTIEQLQNLYKNGGVDARSRAALDTIRRSEDRVNRGNMGAIEMDARSRGIGGGSPLSKIVSAIGSADRRSAADTQVYGQNEGRAMDALLGSADLAGGVRGQDFQKMSALDRIRQFNKENSINAYQRRFGNSMDVKGARADLYTGKGASRAAQYNQQFGTGAGILKELWKSGKQAAAAGAGAPPGAAGG